MIQRVMAEDLSTDVPLITPFHGGVIIHVGASALALTAEAALAAATALASAAQLAISGTLPPLEVN